MATMRKLLISALLVFVAPVGADELAPAPNVTAPIAGISPVLAQPAAAPLPAQQAADLLIHALSMIGVKYKWGGSSVENGFDCSGFVRHVFQEATGLDLPRNSAGISKLGDTVDPASLVPGDLVFFNTLRRRFSHVAIYIGEGRFVHAPRRGKSVEIADMNDSYWKKRFNGAKRLLQASTD